MVYYLGNWNYRYEGMSTSVEVTEGAATVVNFTLKSHNLIQWSRAYDFNIAENLKNDSYTSAKDVKEILTKLARYVLVDSLSSS